MGTQHGSELRLQRHLRGAQRWISCRTFSDAKLTFALRKQHRRSGYNVRKPEAIVRAFVRRPASSTVIDYIYCSRAWIMESGSTLQVQRHLGGVPQHSFRNYSVSFSSNLQCRNRHHLAARRAVRRITQKHTRLCSICIVLLLQVRQLESCTTFSSVSVFLEPACDIWSATTRSCHNRDCANVFDHATARRKSK